METIAGFVLFRRGSSGNVEFLLLERTTEPGNWSPPKGHAEGDESTMEAAYRETREETSLLPEHYQIMVHLFQYFEYDRIKGKKQVSVWPAELTALDQPIVISKEHRDYKWVEGTEALRLVKKQYKPTYVHLIQQLANYYN